MAAARPSGRVKGAPLRALVELLAMERSRAELDAIVAQLSDEDRAALAIDAERPGLGILAGSWYSAAACGALMDAVWGSLDPRERESFDERVADHVMKTTLTGVHRAVFRLVGSPSLMRDRGQMFWDRQFDCGRVKISDLGPGRQRHEYHAWAAHHPLLCRITFKCVAPMFRAMGLREPRVELEQCIERGAPHCAAIVRWSE